MKPSCLALLPGLVLPLTVTGSTFSENLDRLAAENPEFVAYADFSGDFEAAGAFLTDAYLAYLMSGPEIPPVPVDFKRVFSHLGLSSLETVTAVSDPRPGGGFNNQMLFRFTESPKGLFRLFGDTNQPITVHQKAPSDADLVAEFNLNGIALFEIVRSVVIDIMGPMGQGLVDGRMNQPVVPDGPTLADIINRLTTRIQIAASPEAPRATAGAPGVPPVPFLHGKSVIHIANVADLLNAFTPMLQQAGFSPIEDPDGKTWKMEIPQGPMPVSIYLHTLSGSNDLIVAFNEMAKAWYLNTTTSISSSEAFVRETEGLPLSGLSFWYTTERMANLQIDNLDNQLPLPEKYRPILETVKTFLKRYTGPQAGASFLEGDAYRVVAYQPTSYKTNMALAGAVIPLGFAASFAPALEEALEEDMEEGADAPEMEETGPKSPTD